LLNNDHPTDEKSTNLFLSTAHACKFSEVFPNQIASKNCFARTGYSRLLTKNPEQFDELGIGFDGV
jgi:threonine synthase